MCETDAMRQLFILILLFSMDFSCHSRGGAVPYFGIGGQNILNADTPSSQSPQKPFEDYRVTYFTGSQSASLMLSHAASLAVNTQSSQSSPQSLESTQYTAVNTPPINAAANEPTTPSALSFTQAADAKSTEYVLEQPNNKPKNKTVPVFKKRSIFAYNKAPGELNTSLQRTQVPVHTVNPPQSSPAGTGKHHPKLILLDPTKYNDKSRKWQKASTTISLNSDRPLPRNRTC